MIAYWLVAKAFVKRWWAWIRLGLVIAAAFAVAFAVERVQTWHASHLRLQATEKALATSRAEARQCLDREAIAQQAFTEAAAEAKATAERDRATAQRIEDALQTKLAVADARGRDLARRLQDSRVYPGPGGLPAAAGAAAEPAAAAGEPAGADRVGEATAALIGACERDSLRLVGWQEWWRAVSTPRPPAPDHR